MKKEKNSLFSPLIGLLLIIGGIFLIFRNERQNVINIKDVKELREVVIDIKNDNIDNNNNNKLVNVSGKSEYNEVLSDDEFNVSIKTLKLSRVVEVYQWDEDCNDDDSKKCNYTKVWSEKLIDSSKFENRSYVNPKTKTYESENFVVNFAKIGEFTVNQDQISQLSAKTAITKFENVPYSFSVNEEYLTNSKVALYPEIGDMRIKFSYVSDDEITILAKQNNDRLIDYETKEGTKFNKIFSGILDSKQTIDKIESSNNTIKWILRLVTLILEILGFSLLLSVGTMLTSFIPVLGKFVEYITGAISFMLGLMTTLLFTGIAWIVYRPILGIALVSASVIIFILVIKSMNRKKQKVMQTSKVN